MGYKASKQTEIAMNFDETGLNLYGYVDIFDLGFQVSFMKKSERYMNIENIKNQLGIIKIYKVVAIQPSNYPFGYSSFFAVFTLDSTFHNL